VQLEVERAGAVGEVWWAEVAHVRERIERRRATERLRRRRELPHAPGTGDAVVTAGARRTVRITGHAASAPVAVRPRALEAHALGVRDAGRRELADRGVPAPARRRTGPDAGVRHERDAGVRSERDAGARPARERRRRPRRTPAEWLGARPDRIAAWTVALGFLLVLAALLSAH
jgi:hypothetical protein